MGTKIVGVLAALSIAASVAWAGTTAPLKAKQAQGPGYGYAGKVTICHHTGSKKNPFHTITVSANAVPAHLRHGDTIGPCPTRPTVRTAAKRGKSNRTAAKRVKSKKG